MNFADLTIKDAREKLDNKEISAFELTSFYIERIKKLNPLLNVFLTLAEEEALSQAKEADLKLQKGIKRPLLGIPIAAKDLFTTENLKTTAGARIIDNYIPVYDSTAIKRLKDAGSIIIGKTNEDAWGHGSSGENSDFGPTKNPYDLSRVPGGSSSGSAVAVAASMCLAATGTDTGSSVRLPASFCNLVGIKPTYGRVSRYGIIAMASSFDTIGHMTKTIYDCAYIYEVTSGQDKKDATSPALPVPKYTKNLDKGIKGLKIGLPKEYYTLPGMQKEVKDVVEKAIKTLESLGAKFEEISLPHTEYAMPAYYILVPSEVSSNLARFDGIRFGHKREVFGEEAKRRIMLGTYTLSAGYYDAYYLKACKVRTLIKKDFDEAFNKVDALFVPSSPSAPFKLGEKSNDPVQMYLSDIFMCPANLAGVPGLTVPGGFVGDLPIGLQIIGPQFSEELLFLIGATYEKETQWYKTSPKL